MTITLNFILQDANSHHLNSSLQHLSWPQVTHLNHTHPYPHNIGVSKNRGVSPQNHPFVHRVFHEFNHPFWGTPIFGNIHIAGTSRLQSFLQETPNNRRSSTPTTPPLSKNLQQLRRVGRLGLETRMEQLGAGTQRR